MKKKNLLILGINGFVGVNLFKYYTNYIKDYNIFGTIYNRNSDRISYCITKEFQQTEKLSKFVADLESIEYGQFAEYKTQNMLMKIYDTNIYTNYDQLIENIDPTIIFNCINCERDLIDYNNLETDEEVLHTNIMQFYEIMKALYWKGPTIEAIINFSSSSVFGRENYRKKEYDDYEPLNVYGISKVTNELLSKHLSRRYTLPIITLRLFSPFGPYDKRDRFITKIITQCLNNELVELGYKTLARDYIYVEDICKIVETLIPYANEGYHGQIFNVGTGKQHNILEISNLIKKLTNSKSEIVIADDNEYVKSYDTFWWEANNEKLLSTPFGSQHSFTPFEEGLKKTIKWIVKNKEFYLK